NEVVGGVLLELGAPLHHSEDRNAIAAGTARKVPALDDPAVELLEYALRLGRASGHDAIWEKGVVQRAALSEELRIRHDTQAPERAVLEAITRSDGHRGAHQDQGAVARVPRDLDCRGIDLRDTAASPRA